MRYTLMLVLFVIAGCSDGTDPATPTETYTEFATPVVWETTLTFRFRSVKLLDYLPWDALEASTNPFATVVMTHLKTQETRHDPEGRLQWKRALIRCLYERGMARDDVLRLFHFLNRLLWLPDELTTRF